MKTIAVVVLSAVLVAGSAVAQGNGGPGRGNHDGTGPKAELVQAATVTGSVVSFAAAKGEGQPTLVVRDAAGDHSFVVGPYRVIAAQGFAAQVGDQVEVSGWTCTVCDSGFVVAQVKNVTRSLTLVLRTADGTPSWQGGQGVRRNLGRGGNGQPGQGGGNPGCTGTGPTTGGHGRGGQGTHARHCDGAGPDMTRVATFTGAVTSFTGGPGAGEPTLVLAAAGGTATIVLSPYRVLIKADYAPVAGAQVEVVAAPVAVDGVDEWVAVSLKDVATGLVVSFRDATTGLPLGGRGCGRR